MKLLLAFAFLAVASAVTLPQPIKLPAPALPLFQKTEEIPSADASVEPLQAEEAVEDAVVQAVIVVDSADAPEAFDGKVDAVRVVDLPEFEDEYAPAAFPLFSMPDISPLIVPEEVMRQVAEMAAQEASAVFADDASQSEYANAEALEIEPVKVVDSPVNDASEFEYANAEPQEIDPVKVVDCQVNYAGAFENANAEPQEIDPVEVVNCQVNYASAIENANAEPQEVELQVDPVIVVDEAVNDQTAPLESLDAPEAVKVVDAPSEFPQEYLRNPQQDIPMENFYPGHLIGANNPLLRVECPMHF